MNPWLDIQTDTTPSLTWTEPATGRNLRIDCGYINGDPVVAVMERTDRVSMIEGPSEKPIAIIPRAVLGIAYEQGWGGD